MHFAINGELRDIIEKYIGLQHGYSGNTEKNNYSYKDKNTVDSHKVAMRMKIRLKFNP